MFNAATEAVKQRHCRRQHGHLRVDHPTSGFIDCKKDNSDITNFNISAGITNYEAVKKARTILIDPNTKKSGYLERQKVYDKIVGGGNGELYCVFDRPNKFNSVPTMGEIESQIPWRAASC